MGYDLFDLGVGVPLALVGQDLAQLVGRDGSAAVTIEDSESIEELLLRVGLLPGYHAHDLEEF